MQDKCIIKHTMKRLPKAHLILKDEGQVHFIEDTEGVRHMATHLGKAVLIGIDTETKPLFGKRPFKQQCSLLQIAMRDAVGREDVFILDLQRLQAPQYDDVLAQIFLSNKLLKLGQGLFEDMKELASSFAEASCFEVIKNVVEINDMSRQLTGTTHLISLKNLVAMYLDLELDKGAQLSNWNQRPLTKRQLTYAALDALVLLHLYDVLKQKISVEKVGFDISSISSNHDVTILQIHPCVICCRSFGAKEHLLSHLLKSQTCKEVDPNTITKCKSCSKNFKNLHAVSDHLIASQTCRRKTIGKKKKARLSDALTTSESPSNDSITLKSVFQQSCTICAKTYPDCSKFEAHSSCCQIMKPYLYSDPLTSATAKWRCPVCDMILDEPSHLMYHLDNCNE